MMSSLDCSYPQSRAIEECIGHGLAVQAAMDSAEILQKAELEHQDR